MMAPKPKEVTPSNSNEIIPEMTASSSNDVDTSFEIDEPDEDDFVFIGSFNEKPVIVSSSRNKKINSSTTCGSSTLPNLPKTGGPESHLQTSYMLGGPEPQFKENELIIEEFKECPVVAVEIQQFTTDTDLDLDNSSSGGGGGSGGIIGCGGGGGGGSLSGSSPMLKNFQKTDEDLDSDSPVSSVLLSGSSTPTTADVADFTLNNQNNTRAIYSLRGSVNRNEENLQNVKPTSPSTVITMQNHFMNTNNINNNIHNNNNTKNNNKNNNTNNNSSGCASGGGGGGGSSSGANNKNHINGISNGNNENGNGNNNYNNDVVGNSNIINNTLQSHNNSGHQMTIIATATTAATTPTNIINNSASIADDNLSASIATTVTTTTTEVDIDNITIATSSNSPNLINKIVPNNKSPYNNSNAHNIFKRNSSEKNNRSHRNNHGGVSDDVDVEDHENNSIVNIFNSINVGPSSVNDVLHNAFGGKKTLSGHKRTQSSTSQISQRSQLPQVDSLQPKKQIWRWICTRFKSIGIGKPSVYHAMIVIFLEYFAWGLLTMPVIQNLKHIFPHHTFLMNGMLLGIKGLLSFLSAPLVGALSDIWGRKIFFLVTVFFTCSPIPLLTINLSWFFAMISISGIFAVTFSVVFAYVADVTTVEERSKAYGLVSATFAASLVISPALGDVLMDLYGDAFVVAICIAIAVLDIFFILVAVPESLPEKIRPSSWGAPINWEQADPFAALRKVGTNRTVMMQCVTVLLSNLPEAGQYSSIFVYLKWKIGFNTLEVSIFIAFVGILSITVQVTLGFFMRVFGAKSTIIIGLTFEMIQMLWFGLANEPWMMWGAGLLAALGSIAYPAISAFVSIHSNADNQGAVQGTLTGVRGLCNGLGPAVFGVIFYIFGVDMDETTTKVDGNVVVTPDRSKLVPGPPFLFGAVMVVIAICVAVFIPETPHAEDNTNSFSRTSSDKKHVQYEIESGRKLSTTMLDARAPLMRSDSMAQL